MSIKRVDVVLTRQKHPAMWECGGGKTNTGQATIITRDNGDRPKAIYITTKGHRSCGNHALIVVAVNMLVIDVNRNRDTYEVNVYHITKISDDRALLQKVLDIDYFGNQTNYLYFSPPDQLKNAIASAKEKAETWHCQEPFYIQ